MNDQSIITQIEMEIDEAFAASPLPSIGYAQATWTLLSVAEDRYLRAIRDAVGDHDMPIFCDGLLNALTHPLRVCFKAASGSDPLRDILIDDHYRLGWEWIDAAEDYNQFTSIFPLLRRKQIDLAIDGHRLTITHLVERERQYEAYNRLVQKEARPEPDVGAMPVELDRLLTQATIARDDWFRVNFNPRLVDALVSWLSPYFDSRHTLPDNWEFVGFTLSDFRAVFTTLQAMLFAWHAVRSGVANAGMPGLGYRSAVWVVTREELLARLRRYTKRDLDVIEKLLSLLTFGSSGIRVPDVAMQPLIDLHNGSYALSPFVWLNSSVERNLCVLVNQIPEQQRVYADLTNAKETATKQEIVDFLTPFGFSFADGKLAGTDLDLAVIDHNEKVCLCIELKWFIEPAEIREIAHRAKELAKGVAQAKKIAELYRNANAKLLEMLNISRDYEFLAIVASQNWIGFDDVQDASVPIIKVWHLLSKIKEAHSLLQTMLWLKKREYLPIKYKDYTVLSMEITCAPWCTTWYGLKPT